MKPVFIILLLIGYNPIQEGKLLFTTNHLDVKRLSQPEEKYTTIDISWVWDYYSTTTLLIKQPDNDEPNTVYEIQSLIQDGQTYYLTAKRTFSQEYCEIILNRTAKSVEIKSLSPVQGINLKYYHK